MILPLGALRSTFMHRSVAPRKLGCAHDGDGKDGDGDGHDRISYGESNNHHFIERYVVAARK